jgi:tetratricopeptide (TPR) repeat protein
MKVFARMPEPCAEEGNLMIYRDLAERLWRGYLPPDEAASSARQAAIRAPSSTSAVQKLLTQAGSLLWYAPRRSWALSCVARAVAQALGQDSLAAESALALAAALNGLGRFAQALTLLTTAAEHSASYEDSRQAIRCSVETGLSSTYLGRIQAAEAAFSRARELLAETDDSLLQAYCDRAEGLFHLVHNRYSEGVVLLRCAAEAFAAAGRQGEAALSWCDLAETARYLNPQEALDWLNRARDISVPGGACLHDARCDHVLALIYDELNRYAESLALHRQARPVFLQEGMDFLTAFCDMHQGVAHYRLNQYDEALKMYNTARASFAAQELSSQVAMCDLNIAIIYYLLNRYAEALALYEQVARAAEAEGRVLRAARCYTNMGQCYDRLGRYDRALVLHDRARRAFLESESAVYAALCQENLAGTYRALGRHDLALIHYRQTRDTFLENRLAANTAYCNLQMADLHLAMGQAGEAKRCLESARRVYQEEGMAVRQALAERLLARVALALGEDQQGLDDLAKARQTFASHTMPVEVALCDLLEGEIRLETNHIRPAEELFRKAGGILSPAFPDQAWCVEEGLGRCALARGDKAGALHHWALAAGFITRARDTLPTERLSGDYFAGRQYIFQAAIELAVGLDEAELALRLAEAAKARAFLSHPWSLRLRPEHRNDSYLAGLIAREEVLRQQLASLRNQLTVSVQGEEPQVMGVVTRGGPEMVLQELAELSREYEEVVDQLRLAASPGAAMLLPAFSLDSFRQAAAAHLPGDWACLEYHFSGDRLFIFHLDRHRLRTYVRQLTPHDSLILRQCVSPQPERRELIYRGTIQGFPVPGDPGRLYRQHLGELLIPPEIRALASDGLLIVIPHGPLHGLPFHALFTDGQPLMERVPLVYVPSLQALESLWTEQVVPTAGATLLACGLEDFHGRARQLPHAAREVHMISEMFPDNAHVLYGEEATVSSLKHMSASGRLARFGLVHFAAHTITDPAAPTLSRVLLADDDLAVSEVLELQMAARLVTLSTCQAAVGEVRPGDEMMTLARAFFYAGTQAVVASLWAVEDEATLELMGHFYQRLQGGESIPHALRQAQMALCRAGGTVYQWAPFVVIGRP